MAGPLTITVDASKAIAALGALSGPGMQAKLSMGLREAALLGEREVAGKTPVRTGALRASVKATQQGPLAWKIASPLPYAAIVEGGSRPHTITPKRAKLLSFQVGGARVFARRVNHPGTRAVGMFKQGAATLQAALPGILARIVGGAP